MLSIAFSRTLSYAPVMVDHLHTIAFYLYVIIGFSTIAIAKRFDIATLIFFFNYVMSCFLCYYRCFLP